jgi:hypothetical protein
LVIFDTYINISIILSVLNNKVYTANLLLKI